MSKIKIWLLALHSIISLVVPLMKAPLMRFELFDCKNQSIHKSRLHLDAAHDLYNFKNLFAKICRRVFTNSTQTFVMNAQGCILQSLHAVLWKHSCLCVSRSDVAWFVIAVNRNRISITTITNWCASSSVSATNSPAGSLSLLHKRWWNFGTPKAPNASPSGPKIFFASDWVLSPVVHLSTRSVINYCYSCCERFTRDKTFLKSLLLLKIVRPARAPAVLFLTTHHTIYKLIVSTTSV